jgi:hypothetical protein
MRNMVALAGAYNVCQILNRDQAIYVRMRGQKVQLIAPRRTGYEDESAPRLESGNGLAPPSLR